MLKFGKLSEPEVEWKKPKEPKYPPKSKHVYGSGEKTKWKSVTGLISKLFPFNQKEIAEKLAKRYKKGNKHKIYSGLKPYEIVWLWFEQATVGSVVHEGSEKYSKHGTVFKYTNDTFRKYRTGSFIKDEKIQKYYLKTLRSLSKKVRKRMWTKETGKFMEKEVEFFILYDNWMRKRGFVLFQYDAVDGLGFPTKGVGAEVRIMGEFLKLCGTFDYLYYNPSTKELIVSDLKRAKDKICVLNLQKLNEEAFLKKAKRVEDVFADYREILEKKTFWKNKNYIKYALQLAIYTRILIKGYGLKNFKEMHIVRLNAEKAKGPEVTKIDPFIFDKRLERIEQIISNMSIN